MPKTVAKVKISEKTKKGATVVASSKYKFELTPVEALDVTDGMLADAQKYAQEDKGAKEDGYGCDVEALVAAATKRRDDAVSAKRAADEAAAKAEEERKAAESAAQEHAAEDAFVATARKGLGIPDDLEGVTYKLLGGRCHGGLCHPVLQQRGQGHRRGRLHKGWYACNEHPWLLAGRFVLMCRW